MAAQTYKIATTYAHEIPKCTILYRLIYARNSHLGGMNGDIQSDLDNMAPKQGENLMIFIA